MVLGGCTLVVSQTFFYGGTPEIIFHILIELYQRKRLQNRKKTKLVTHM
jgi:hypothetical protein